ncbi:MAG: hypothetical protein HZC24_17800 [Rhodocyclales bacterium]|nr:hypothetical protein [Rhodocyclales bacterium]
MPSTIPCLLLSFALMSTSAVAEVALTATPLSREQVTAFYLARGFPAAAIAAYAENCVLSFDFKNGGATKLHTNLDEWTAGDGVRIRPLAAWETVWEQQQLPQAARIAFRWAQFPPQQEFAPGDWIMGMAATDRPLAGPFRVAARYTDDHGSHELLTAPIACID